MIGDSVWRLDCEYNMNTERVNWNRKDRRPFYNYNLKESEYGIVKSDEHFENRWEFEKDRQHQARTWERVKRNKFLKEGREEGITFGRQFGMYQESQQMAITWNRVQRKEEFEWMGKGRRNNISKTARKDRQQMPRAWRKWRGKKNLNGGKGGKGCQAQDNA